MDNPIITAMLNRRSVRRYTAQQPSDEVIQTIVRAGQQAPDHEADLVLLGRPGPHHRLLDQAGGVFGHRQAGSGGGDQGAGAGMAEL